MHNAPPIDDVEEFVQEQAEPTWALATQIPFAQGEEIDNLACVWTDEWQDEDETWGVALNGSGRDRLWYGPLYTFPTDDTVAVEHPAGTAVIGVDGQAVAVLKPDGPEWFCDQENTKVWNRAVLYAVRDHLVDLGTDLPHVEDLVEERGMP